MREGKGDAFQTAISYLTQAGSLRHELQLAMINDKEDVLVIGLGNTLCGDDALGRIASERVQALVDSRQVRVISQCSLTPELAAAMAEVSLVIFLDAAADGPADRIATQQLAATDPLDPITHRLDADALLGLTGHLYGHIPESFAITFRGASFGYSDQQLSPEACAACDLLVQETLRLIGNHAPLSTDQHLEHRSCTNYQPR